MSDEEGVLSKVAKVAAIMNPVTGCPIAGLVAGASAVIDELAPGPGGSD